MGGVATAQVEKFCQAGHENTGKGQHDQCRPAPDKIVHRAVDAGDDV